MQSVVLIGMKSSGKTSVGQALAQTMQAVFVDVDSEIEQQYTMQHHATRSFREIFHAHGRAYFRTLEQTTLAHLADQLQGKVAVLATGGGTPLEPENQPFLRSLGTIVFLDTDRQVLLSRITAGGIPAFFPYPDDPQRSLDELLAARRPIYAQLADITIACGDESPAIVATMLANKLEHVYAH
jgi:shikimate kinase